MTGTSRYVGRLFRTLITGSAASVSTTLVVAAGTLLAKTAGFGKELVVAAQLGVGPELDAFLFAYVFPVFLINVAGSAFLASFVPRYLATEAQVSPGDARRLAGECSVLVLVATVLLAFVAIPVTAKIVPRLAGGFDPNTQLITIRLLPVLMPVVVLSVLTSFWAGLLNASGRFSTVAFVPTITPIVVLSALYAHIVPSGAMCLAIGTVLGATIEVGLLAYRARAIGFELFIVPRKWRTEYGQIMRQFVPAAGSIVLMSITSLIDQSFAANLSSGNVSALSYGTRLASVASSILVVVVSTVTLPTFSRLAALGDFLALRRSFLSICVLVAFVTVPLAAFLSFEAESILHVLFTRGSFTSNDAALAASVQRLHAWHLPAYVLSVVAVRALASMYATWIMLVGSIANLVVDVLVNVLFIPTLGVAAIGMASTAMYVTSTLVLGAGLLLSVRGRIARMPRQ